MNFFEEDISPELDTIRIFYFCRKKADIKRFFEYRSTDFIKSFQRLNYPNLAITPQDEDEEELAGKWEKYRLDMRNSWWGKMQILQGAVKFGKGKDTQEYGIFFEYSFAKWNNVSNGFNNGISALESDFLEPIKQALYFFKFLDYTEFKTYDELYNHLENHYIIRRLDLSINFQTQIERFSVRDYMQILSTCRINNHNTKYNCNTEGDYSTLSWGGGRGSSYKVMFYNKEEEQKIYFSLSQIDNTENFKEQKKQFYKQNKEKLKGVIRFEIQFKSKFFLDRFKERYKFIRNKEQAVECMKYANNKWHQILFEIDSQIGSRNTQFTDEIGSPFQKTLNYLEDLRQCGGISNTVYNNLFAFMTLCKEIGWENVRSRYASNQAFSKIYCTLKKLTSYDVKRECVERLPIIYISETPISHLESLRNEFYLPTSEVFQFNKVG